MAVALTSGNTYAITVAPTVDPGVGNWFTVRADNTTPARGQGYYQYAASAGYDRATSYGSWISNGAYTHLHKIFIDSVKTNFAEDNLASIQYIGHFSTTYPIGGSAVEFTAGASGNLTSVEFYLNTQGGTGSGELTLYVRDGGRTGTIIGTATATPSSAGTWLEFTFDAAPEETTDGNDTGTLILVKSDGADGSTSFINDAAGTDGNPIVTSGNAEIDTIDPKWGTGSAVFGNTDTETPNAITGTYSGYVLQFTVDFWIRFSQADQVIDRLFTLCQIGLWKLQLFYQGAFGFYMFVNDAQFGYPALWDPDWDTWYHIAYIRYYDGTTYYRRLYANGSLIALPSSTNTGTGPVSSGTFFIGDASTGNEATFGSIDEFRLCEGDRSQNPNDPLYNGGDRNTILVPEGPYPVSGNSPIVVAPRRFSRMVKNIDIPPDVLVW